MLLTGLSGQWWEQPQSHTGLNAAFCRASMVFFISVPSLIDSCMHKQWEDRQTSGTWRVQYSKFFIFGVFFEFLNIRHICTWVLGAFHGFLTPLKSAVLVHFWSAERTSHLSAPRKKWKTFLRRNIKTPPSMVPSSSHEATSGLSPAPLTLPPVWFRAFRSLSCIRKVAGGGTEELPVPALRLKSLQRVFRG